MGAGGGSLLLEFCLLSRLVGDPIYEIYARRAARALYTRRNIHTGLVGNVVDILHSLNNHTRAKCGYATVHDVHDMSLEDRQESFFLSETVKYLFLLFDTDNPVNHHTSNYLFTTEGHVLPISNRFRKKSWDEDGLFSSSLSGDIYADNNVTTTQPTNTPYCDIISPETRFSLPLRNRFLQQVFAAFGL